MERYNGRDCGGKILRRGGRKRVFAQDGMEELRLGRVDPMPGGGGAGFGFGV